MGCVSKIYRTMCVVNMCTCCKYMICVYIYSSHVAGTHTRRCRMECVFKSYREMCSGDTRDGQIDTYHVFTTRTHIYFYNTYTYLFLQHVHIFIFTTRTHIYTCDGLIDIMSCEYNTYTYLHYKTHQAIAIEYTPHSTPSCMCVWHI